MPSANTSPSRTPRSTPESAPRVNGGGPLQRLDTGCLIEQTRFVDEILRKRVVGQNEAIEALVCAISRVFSSLHDPSRPIFTTLFLGPTGVGKTETARALAEALLGSPDALVRINSQEYAQGHEISKLLGSPPGYVGHNIEPLLSQARIDEPARQAILQGTGIFEQDRGSDVAQQQPISVILFDEIEKAHPLLWNALLGILEEGRLTLGDNTTTDFTRSIVLLTSNVGGRQLQRQSERRRVGFGGTRARDRERNLAEAARKAAHRRFPAEFLNRLDLISAYSPLRRRHLSTIFDRMLSQLHNRIVRSGFPFLIKVSSQAKRMIIEGAIDPRFGARPLKRALESSIVDPVSRLIASGELQAGDVVEVKRENNKLTFYRSQQQGLVS